MTILLNVTSFHPYERQSSWSMLTFILFKYSRVPVKSRWIKRLIDCFLIVVKALLHDVDPYMLCFPCVVNVPRSHMPVLLAMQ